MYDVSIIGSGPAGLFAALELERFGIKSIAIFDQTKYSTGGLYNDGKLNFNSKIGLDLESLQLSFEDADNIIEDIKGYFVSSHFCKQVTDTSNPDIQYWIRVAKRNNVDLLNVEQYHYGSDNAKAVIHSITSRLHNTTFFLNTEVNTINEALSFRNHKCKVLLICPGRAGAFWLRDVADTLGMRYLFGPIDIGIRVELRKEIMQSLTDVIYDPKFLFQTKRHDDKVRTFCTNPGGRVRIETHNGYKLVNGDSLSNHKTSNTNFALLTTLKLTEPFSDSIEFSRMVAQLFYLLGGGKPIVQRVGDFREGHRSNSKTFNNRAMHFDYCSPSCNCTPGDISLAFPARIMDNLWETLKVLDKIVPGILHPSTLMYAPEIKTGNLKYITDKQETTKERVFVAGDGAGQSRGIVGAAVSGITAARQIVKKYF